ncbi:Uncharacterized protein TCM_036660 [Theobroma cacao]|uniref:Ubiquitin-like protease family profile domain-containing protein n=1 Tax=Theobroma cacao TaxID=3641 RepID=A0A061FLA4_THECC|nr:Uncharacterized protein TCM_036660 [Theobroma cacao]
MRPSPTEKTFKPSEAVMPDELLEYARGGKPPWGLPWHEMSPLTSLFPIICHQAGYLVSSHHQKQPLSQMKYKLNEKTQIQKDSYYCGDWVIAALQSLISSDDQTLKANAIEGIRTKFTLEIFANSLSC